MYSKDSLRYVFKTQICDTESSLSCFCIGETFQAQGDISKHL